MNDSLEVAAAQLASSGDVETDIAAVVDAIHAADGARLLVLPELFLGGYRLPPIVVGESDPRLDVIESAATAADMTVLVGACLDGPAGFTISTLRFGTGQPHRLYDKQNPCDDEKRHIVPGDRGVIIDVAGWAVGVGICYDACFPEHARALAVAGADLYAVSIAYFPHSAHRREVHHRARALENGMFVVVSGLTGSVADQRFDGGSAVIDSEGRLIAEAGDDERIIHATLRRDELRRTRERHPLLVDRREPPEVERR